MKKLIALLLLPALLSLSIRSSAQTDYYFTTAIGIFGPSNNQVVLKDVVIAGSESQTGATYQGSFQINQFGALLPENSQILTDYGYYTYDPISLYHPVILHSRTTSTGSYITLNNLTSSSKSITIYQIYAIDQLVSSETFNLPANATGYQHYLQNDAAKTFNSDGLLNPYGLNPPPDAATYYLRVVVNN